MWIFRKPNKRMFLDWRGYLAGTVLMALATVLKYFTQPAIIATPNSLPYILAIVIIAIYFGLGPAIFSSILSVAIYHYFFIEPFNSFTLSWIQDIPTVVIFLVVGIIVSFLASNLSHKSEEAEQLSARLITSQEEEKRRIARELHDDTSPTLAYMGLELDALIKKTQIYLKRPSSA